MQEAFDEDYVRTAAAALDLALSPERVQAVADNLQRMAVIASPLLEVVLEPEDESAPVWRP
jgi:hypothetical protein